MKRVLWSAVVITILAVGLAGCGSSVAEEPASSTVASTASTAATLPPTTASTAPPTTVAEVVVFNDPVLEGLVRTAMNRPDGDITLAEAAGVTKLDLQMEGGVPIARVGDISDLKYFPNLTYLNLNWALWNDGKDIDISVLSSLTKLEGLYLACCEIANISPLKDLTGIKELWIFGNKKISDISALAGMNQLETIWMQDNQISDISALAGMTKLKRLQLSENAITDFSPLKDIYPNLVEKDFEL